MKFKLSIAIISVLIVFTSCNCNIDQADENKGTEHVSTHDCDDDKHPASANNEHHDESTILKFNGDEKWEVNNATGIGMTKMKEILSAVNLDGMTVEQYHKLGEKLSEQTDYIINKCDMDGPAHDNLHVILTEILTDISGIKEAESADTGKTHVNNLNKDIKTYFEYFRSV